MAHLGQHVPEKTYARPVRLVVKWCFPITGKRQDGEYKMTRPDIDNSQKLLFDCMTDLKFWKDDALVVSLVAEKFWAKRRASISRSKRYSLWTIKPCMQMSLTGSIRLTKWQ
ncbi:RusA family crossover junction endodeoxyribonuclease [Paenibacillus larvae]|nr:RusA family crossover junction endodeoxyribonuclease [Paenibacillus larvae]